MQATRKAEIETLLAQITPGEWTTKRIHRDRYQFGPLNVYTESKPGLETWIPYSHEDAAFIAAAPGIVRELLKEVEQLNVELGTVQSMLQAVTGETFPVEQLWDDLENEDD